MIVMLIKTIKMMMMWVKMLTECQDDINPDDSLSNVPSKRSSRRSHSRSVMSSTSSACLKAKAEKAALMEKALLCKGDTNLRHKRRNSDRRQTNRKIKEQLDIDAQIAAAAA